MKLAPPCKFALHPDSSSHHFHEPARNGQSQSSPAVFPRGRRIRLCKGIEDYLLLLPGNADPGIRHRKPQREIMIMSCFHLNFQRDFALVREFDGVPNQVHEDLAQSAGVSSHGFGHVGSDFAQQLQPLFVGSYRQSFQCRLQTIAQVEIDSLDIDLSCFNLGEVQNVVDNR